MDTENDFPQVRGALLNFSNRLAETPGRYEDARVVAQLLAEWDGMDMVTGEARVRSLNLAALRDRLAAIDGAEDVFKVIDAAIAASAE